MTPFLTKFLLTIKQSLTVENLHIGDGPIQGQLLQSLNMCPPLPDADGGQSTRRENPAQLPVESYVDGGIPWEPGTAP